MENQQVRTGNKEVLTDLQAEVTKLQEQVQALTAENVKLVNYVNDECYVENPRTGVYKCAGNDKPTTPATDAAIREIKAQGVDDLLAYLPREYMARYDIGRYAAQLRAKPEGEQL